MGTWGTDKLQFKYSSFNDRNVPLPKTMSLRYWTSQLSNDVNDNW